MRLRNRKPAGRAFVRLSYAAVGLMITSLVVGALALHAQPTPDVMPPGVTHSQSTPQVDQPITPAVPFAATLALTPVAPLPDARASACPAFSTPGFAPFTVRPGDTLDLLLLGHTLYIPAQIAAMNCLDSEDLPSGATVWLPEDSIASSLVTRDPLGSFFNESLRVVPERASVLNTERLTLSWEADTFDYYSYLCMDRMHCFGTENMPSRMAVVQIELGGFQQAGIYSVPLVWQGDEDPLVPYVPREITQTVEIEITCTYTWLVPQNTTQCPDAPPQTLFAVYQPFEHGAMLYRSDLDQILVFTPSSVRAYPDNYVEGIPDPVQQAPEGLFTPVRGFGVIWSALEGEQGLGWATAPERGYDMQMQPAGRNSFTTYMTVPPEQEGEQSGIGIGSVIALTGFPDGSGSWAQIEPVQPEPAP